MCDYTILALTDNFDALGSPQPDDLHLGVVAGLGLQDVLYSGPHAEYGACKNVVGTSAQPHLAVQAQRHVLAVTTPTDTPHISMYALMVSEFQKHR